MLINIESQADFSEKVLKTLQPVLVDFWAPWCGPCKMIAPELEALAVEYEGKALIAKINVDDHPQIASQYHVTGIPTLLILKGGVEVNRLVGYRPKKDISTALNEVIK